MTTHEIEHTQTPIVASAAVRVPSADGQAADMVDALPSTEVFTATLAANADALLRLAVAMCGDRDAAEDLVADAAARTWIRWERGRVDDLPAYLRRAVVNGAKNRFRRLRVERREAARRRGDDRGHRGATADVDDRAVVLPLLARLPVRQRAAVALRIVADLSEAQTAEVLGCPVGTVKSLTSRGLARLRELSATAREDLA